MMMLIGLVRKQVSVSRRACLKEMCVKYRQNGDLLIEAFLGIVKIKKLKI